MAPPADTPQHHDDSAALDSEPAEVRVKLDGEMFFNTQMIFLDNDGNQFFFIMDKQLSDYISCFVTVMYIYSCYLPIKSNQI